MGEDDKAGAEGWDERESISNQDFTLVVYNASSLIVGIKYRGI